MAPREAFRIAYRWARQKRAGVRMPPTDDLHMHLEALGAAFVGRRLGGGVPYGRQLIHPDGITASLARGMTIDARVSMLRNIRDARRAA